MRLPLDTDAPLWWTNDALALGEPARRVMLGTRTVRISTAGVWEIATKTSLGKLQVDLGALLESARHDGFVTLPVTEALAGRSPTSPGATATRSTA